MKFFIILLLTFLSLFLLRYFSSLPHFKVGEHLKITTKLGQEPLSKGNKQLLSVYNIRVLLSQFPEYHYSDKLEITGTLSQDEYGLYLEKPQAKLLEKHGAFTETRIRIIEFINQNLPEREAALVAGVTIGASETLPQDFKKSLIRAGLLHIVVASGMNVTIVARTLIGVLAFFVKRQKALIFALSGIWGYVFLIGVQPAILRAAIMGTLAFTAQETGRVYWAWWGLFLSAALMLFLSPSWITDVGFLLSFAATAGILGFEKPINNLLARVGLATGGAKAGSAAVAVKNTIIQDFSTSLSAQFGTTPILFLFFGQFTPWSPIVNALLLWTIAPIMAFGFSGALLGVFFAPIGKLLIMLTYPLAFLFVKIVSWF